MFKNSKTLELKKSYSVRIVTDVAAFLNTEGGTIIVGIDNNSFIGVEKDEVIIKKATTDIEKAISPDPLSYVTIKPFSIGEDKHIIIIDVEKSNNLHYIANNDTKRYYFRRSSDNVGYDEKEALIKTYKNHGINSIAVVNIEGYTHHKIGNYAKGTYFYKYMSLETALLCIRNKTIRFAEPSSWQDKYESRFYNATIKSNQQSPVNPPLAACCFTYSRDNEAAWKIYAYDKKGLDSRCVEFKIDRDELRKQMHEALNTDPKLKGKYKLYEGVVLYKDEQFINNLHMEKITRNGNDEINVAHKAYFDSFSLNSYLSLMLLKRNAFLHEQEVRFFLVPIDDNLYNKGALDPIDIPLNWSKILKEVRIDGNCTQFEKDLFKDELFTKGYSGSELPKEKKTDLTPTSYNVYDQKDGRPLKIK